MNLAAFVAQTAEGLMPLLPEGSVTFTAPAGEVTAGAPDGTLDLVVNGAFLTGATSVELRNDSGDGLRADLPKGSVVTLNGQGYAVAHAEVNVDTLEIRLASALVADLADGDPASVGLSVFEVANSVTLSVESMFADGRSVTVDFAFQVARLDVSVIPAPAWHVERTTSSGVIQRGHVALVDATETVVLVYVGRKS